jgi:hypothetical protein
MIKYTQQQSAVKLTKIASLPPALQGEGQGRGGRQPAILPKKNRCAILLTTPNITMEPGMAKATKTIRQKTQYRPGISEWFETTQELFNNLVGFYFEVIQAYPDVLNPENKEALGALERLTHATKRNPNPVMPDTEVSVTRVLFCAMTNESRSLPQERRQDGTPSR